MERLRELDLPVLLTCGDLDFPGFLERQQRLETILPTARACVVPGAAHLPSFERPDVFDAELARFLGDIEADERVG